MKLSENEYATNDVNEYLRHSKRKCEIEKLKKVSIMNKDEFRKFVDDYHITHYLRDRNTTLYIPGGWIDHFFTVMDEKRNRILVSVPYKSAFTEEELKEYASKCNLEFKRLDYSWYVPETETIIFYEKGAELLA